MTVSSDWAAYGGYVVNVTVTNTGTKATTAWNVTLKMNNSTVVGVWNATNSGTSGTVTFSSMSYNGVIAANGGTQTFGFQGATSTTSNYLPTVSSVSYN